MKIPRTPPDLKEKLGTVDLETLMRLMSAIPDDRAAGKYLHWDDLRHRTPPEGVSLEEWWLLLKWRRQVGRDFIPLVDSKGVSFSSCRVDPIPESLHRIDMAAGGSVGMPDVITTPEGRDRFYIRSLIEEAITSSQLEGAVTTRKVAKEMLRSGRAPRDRAETMIVNNFLTMRRIAEVKAERLSPELVLDLHRRVTEGTLDDPGASGRLRPPGSGVAVVESTGEVFHDPPPARQLEERMRSMCRFANEEQPFVHPVLRSIILHFWLAYDHPFEDGNGRTARALFYWSMLRRGYWLAGFLSISRLLRKAPAQYARSFLLVETDENDLTYFILHQLRIILRALDELHRYVDRKSAEVRELESRIRAGAILNHRQLALLGHALRHPRFRYTIASHRMSHNVVYETARSDLTDLAARGLLRKTKVGRTIHFIAESDLETRVDELE